MVLFFGLHLSLGNIIYGCLGFFLIKCLYDTYIRVCRLPPGPWGLPVFGYLPFLKRDSHLQFYQFSKKYGNVFSIKIGVFDTVIVNGYAAIKEALSSDDLIARPSRDMFSMLEDVSFVEMSGDDWRDQRRVALKTLRNVGLGKTKMEEVIKDEIKDFIEHLKTIKEPINTDEKLTLTIPNNISILLFGHKFDYDDPRKLELDTQIKMTDSDSCLFNLISHVPWTLKLVVMLKIIRVEIILNALKKVTKLMLDEIHEHKQKPQSDEIDDYIDGYLQEMPKREDDKKTTFTVETLKMNAIVFYSAGSNTIRHTLMWALQILVAYPEFQDKIRNEIRQVIGKERLPDHKDRDSMPFTMAFIYELERFSSLVPTNLPRRATKDIVIDNTFIPKGSIVHLNFWSVHYDPELWTDPEVFDPKRFLNEDASKTIKSPYFLPFSGGKRVCPGASLADLQLFLYIVSILQTFQLSADKDENVSLEGYYTMVRTPKKLVNLILKEV